MNRDDNVIELLLCITCLRGLVIAARLFRTVVPSAGVSSASCASLRSKLATGQLAPTHRGQIRATSIYDLIREAQVEMNQVVRHYYFIDLCVLCPNPFFGRLQLLVELIQFVKRVTLYGHGAKQTLA